MIKREAVVATVGVWAVFLCASFVSGCEGSTPSLRNAGPAVVVVAARPDPGEGAGLLAVDLYIRDLERDPVDLTVSVWRAAGDKEDAVVLWNPGHGSRGLSSDPVAPGAWHRIYLDLAGIPGDEEVFVEIESVDSQGDPGEATATETFRPEAGWTL